MIDVMAHLDDLEITAEIVILGELGKGSFGKVSVGSWNGAPVAVKMLHRIFFELGLPADGSQLGSFLKKFRNEWETMKVLRHPNIVQLFGVADAQTEQAKIVTELMDESLTSRLARTPTLSYQMQLHVLRSIICGLRYLHEHPCGPIVHRDLASKNILLANEASRVKIADLGVAKALGDVRRATTGSIMPGTDDYMPPEVRSNVAIHSSLDIFSYGVIIVETLLSKLPSPSPLFVSERPGDLKLCTEIERREADIKNIPSDHPLRQTMLVCLNSNATRRPTAAHIFSTVFQHMPHKCDTAQEMKQQVGQLESHNSKLMSDNTKLSDKLNGEIMKLTENNARLEVCLTNVKADNDILWKQLYQLQAASTASASEERQLCGANASETDKARPFHFSFPESTETSLSGGTKGWNTKHRETVSTATSVSAETVSTATSVSARAKRWNTMPPRLRPRPQSFPPHHSKDSETVTKPLYVAKDDFEACTDNVLSFKNGDLLYILDNSNKDWWWAKLEIGDKEGYIPSSYVEVYQTLLRYDWFFGKITRDDAEKMLLLPSNQDSSFLIRETESKGSGYSLSVRDGDTVGHYHICQGDLLGFYIVRRRLFKDVADLVAHYREDADGLCVKLKRPCMVTRLPSAHSITPNTSNTSDQMEITGSSIERSCMVTRLPSAHSTTPNTSNASDQMEIAGSSIELVRKLDEGELSEMFEGLWNKPTQVAVKTLKKNSLMSMETFLKEIEIMKKLQHSNIIKLYGACTIEEPIYMVHELLEHGPLLAYLHGDGRNLSMPQLTDMAAQIANGMAYLEVNNCIHLDLGARNILVGDCNVVKIAGFSLAQIVSEGVYYPSSKILYPYRWSAPEALSNHRFSVKSDVWSFGILLMELVTYGSTPYPGMNQAEVETRVAEGYRMPQMAGCPDRLYEIMLMCWKEVDMARPTFKKLKEQLEDINSSLFCITEC